MKLLRAKDSHRRRPGRSFNTDRKLDDFSVQGVPDLKLRLYRDHVYFFGEDDLPTAGHLDGHGVGGRVRSVGRVNSQRGPCP